MSGFKDHFSASAANYARYRPTYPAALFEFLASAAPGRELAWDAGTGNGQVALDLSRVFARVIATDPSREQIGQAPRRTNIEYRVEPAEHSSLQRASADLVSVAQALHWFDLERFYAEVRRVARPGGVIAVWNYAFMRPEEELRPAVGRYYRDVVGPYWPPERKVVESGYRELAFPFEPLAAPGFTLEADWDFEQLFGYLGTWSACRAFEQARGYDPRNDIDEELRAAWGSPARRRRIQWPLNLRVGRIA